MWLFHTLLYVTSKSASPPALRGCHALSTALSVCLSVCLYQDQRSEKVWECPQGEPLSGGVRSAGFLRRAPEAVWQADGLWRQTPQLCHPVPSPASLPSAAWALSPRHPLWAGPQVPAEFVLRVEVDNDPPPLCRAPFYRPGVQLMRVGTLCECEGCQDHGGVCL